MDETFKQNSLLNPDEMQAAPLPKLREIFGADAALYTEETRYDTSYHVISSETALASVC